MLYKNWLLSVHSLLKQTRIERINQTERTECMVAAQKFYCEVTKQAPVYVSVNFVIGYFKPCKEKILESKDKYRTHKITVRKSVFSARKMYVTQALQFEVKRSRVTKHRIL